MIHILSWTTKRDQKHFPGHYIQKLKKIKGLPLKFKDPDINTAKSHSRLSPPLHMVHTGFINFYSRASPGLDDKIQGVYFLRRSRNCV